MRFGLVGTHHWARTVHGAGLASHPDVELVGVWGRRPEAAAEAAAGLGTTAVGDLDELIASVDALAFAVPPDVQADLAGRAARAGRHLLLEKPVATSVAAARELADAAAGVATAVFVTGAYTAARRAWSAQVHADGPWQGASAVWIGAAFAPGSPYATPWRRAKGGLWDVGPHLVWALEDVLGPVEAVTSAAFGRHGLATFSLAHRDGTSTVATSLDAPRAAMRVALSAWGEAGVTEMPGPRPDETLDAYRTAVGELLAAAGGGPAPSVDLDAGVHLVEVLVAAERAAGETAAVPIGG